MTFIKEIRNQITAIKNMQKITKAMEMVAASKMKKIQSIMEKSYPYAEAISRVINHLTLGNLEYKHPYLEQRTIKKIGYLVFSTDRGLCGSLNSNLFRKLFINISKWSKKGINSSLVIIGNKGLSFLNSCSKTMVIAHSGGIGEKASISDLIGPIQVLLNAYNQKEIDRIYIVNNKLINLVSQLPQIIQLLPLIAIKTNHSILNHQYKWDYLYEPDPQFLLKIVLQRYIEAQVYHRLVENIASEQAARMVAMKSATDNGSSLINEMQILYNKARQANITQEITEIVSGAAAV
ncbi:MAG: F0F1 ATP synthase subunit gamma [Candidatus Dasytiphilus stammeri]